MSKRSGSRGVALFLVLVLVAGAGFWWWRGREKQSGAGGRGGAGTAQSVRGSGTGTGTGTGTGQKVARLEGRVRGPGDSAVPGAIIHLDPGEGDATTILAGADGRFVVDDLEPGEYAVSASAPGFVPDVEPELALRGGETTKVELVLDKGGLTLRGTVTDALTGPIAGAVVSAATQNGFFGTRSDRAAAMTDDAGRYTLTLAPGAYRVRASHAEYVGAGAQVELRDAEVVQDFRLVPGGVIEGIVKDEVTGQPVGGATVMVERERGGPGWSEGRGIVTVESNAMGAFRAPGLMPGTLRLRAEVERDGRLTREPVLVPLGVAEQAANVEVFVGAAPFVAGRVVDEEGKPVPGAMVMAMGKQELTSSPSDDEGNFRFVGLKPGFWQLSGSSEHHEADGLTPVTLADAPVEGVIVKVSSAPHITGHVVPAAVAEVKLERDLTQGGIMLWGGGMAMMAATHSGDDGAFDLTPVESGKRVVLAQTADGRRGKVEVDVPAKGAIDVVIKLEERGSIAGRVVDQSGNPVPGAAVHLKKLEGNKRSTFVVNGVDLTTDRAVVGRDGAFIMRGLDKGKYELTVADDRGGRLGWAKAAKGKERAPVTVQLGENEQKTGVELTVELDDGVLRGVVRNPDGTPRAEAWVTASLRHDELMPEHPDGDGPGETSTTIMIVDDGSGIGGAPPVLTDESGRFELRGLRRGTYDLVAEAERGALRGRVDNVRTGSDTAIALAGLASIEGVVTAAGKPVSEFSFEIEGLARRAQTVRDASGKFRIDRIDPGTYTVRIKSAAGVGNGKVIAEAGKTAQVAIALAGATKVRGRLVDDKGTPVANTPVLAMPARASDDEHGSFSFEGTPPTSDADGRFDFEVEAGDYELIILGGPSRPVAPNKKFTAVGGQTADLGDIVVASAAPPPSTPPK
ncbi:MAG TPA: carboxypeptidase-like regulatory domain-containing protein [Kofleriaceae bacterium]|nr:carboxypeptidase-like regulatory domain-containing protein [Kofleriaceae bacterium]